MQVLFSDARTGLRRMDSDHGPNSAAATSTANKNLSNRKRHMEVSMLLQQSVKPSQRLKMSHALRQDLMIRTDQFPQCFMALLA